MKENENMMHSENGPAFTALLPPLDQKIANKSLQCADVAFMGLLSVLLVCETFTPTEALCGKYGNGMSALLPVSS
ncbi:hypothetical protein E5288_WYG010296 [Bos mutus]|uniref:Uncharacterized protein n=1 Tax=Bos mutus TaxID=72004 RepID=A0A6B0R748_9CETA|nr:hypothetical protein [Bos mutus]